MRLTEDFWQHDEAAAVLVRGPDGYVKLGPWGKGGFIYVYFDPQVPTEFKVSTNSRRRSKFAEQDNRILDVSQNVLEQCSFMYGHWPRRSHWPRQRE